MNADADRDRLQAVDAHDVGDRVQVAEHGYVWFERHLLRR